MDAVPAIEPAVRADGVVPQARVLVLGTLRVEHDGGTLHVAGVHRRRLLAFLASRSGKPVVVDTIVDALWGDAPPPTAAKTLQSHVARLRSSLADVGSELIETTPAGYRLINATVDADIFERLAADGHRRLAARDFSGALPALDAALALWRGDPYADLPGVEFAIHERTRLAGIHAAAVEDHAEARLEFGATSLAAAQLERLVSDDPAREHAWALLMRALYAGGRQQDALLAFQRARVTLADEFGLEPGPELRDMERRVLDHDPEMMVARRTELPAVLRSHGEELVGRADELAWLTEAWDAARRGSGQLRVLTGVTDSGRTRLVGQLAATAAGDHAHVTYQRAADNIAEALVGMPGAATSAAVSVVAERSRRQPVLLVVDDVEWASVATIEALGVLVAEVERMPVLLILIADTSGGGPAVHALHRLDPTGGRTRALGPLDDADVARIVASDGIDDPAAQSAIVSIADGLPGVARREAATWAERTAGERVHRAAATSADALAASDDARDAMIDEVARLVRARARRHRLVSAAWAGRQPYLGLAAYGPAEADVFVGREQAVAELAARVLDRRLVVVTGSSGSGKSSIVRAGLVPLVQSGRLPGGGPWRVTVTSPGSDPVRTFEELDELDLPGAQLLIIDQFEEALASSPGTAEALAGKLMDLALDPAVDARIVLVVRADQYPHLAELRPFAELVDEALLVVGRPTEHELRRIVIEPAERAGCRVEPDLVDAIVADVGSSDGTLPLVSAALAALWEARVDDVLTLDGYRSEGGLSASVERLGAQVLDAVRQEGISEDVVRRALMLLVDITEDSSWVRRRIPRHDVPAELQPAFDALVDGRLVVRHDDEYELVHEVVFRAWARLAAWLDDARADISLGRELRLEARAWDDRERPDDDVWRGARLTTAVEWCERNRDADSTRVAEFVAAGVAVADRQRVDTEAQLARERRSTRRLRRALAAASLLLIGALIATTVAVIARRQASDERTRAEADRDAAEVARLVAESERAISGRLDLALLLAVEARTRDDTIETRGALLTALTQTVPERVENVPFGDPLPSALAGFIRTGLDQPLDVDISADGSTVLAIGMMTVGEFGLVAFDVASGAELRRIDEGPVQAVLDPAGTFAVVGGDGSTRVLGLRGGADFQIVDDTAGELTSFSMSPSGETIAQHFADGSVRFYSTRTGAELDLPAPPGRVGFGAFDPTGVYMYTDEPPPEGQVTVSGWNIDTGALGYSSTLDAVEMWPMADSWMSSPDGAVLLGIRPDNKIEAWDAHTGGLLGSTRDFGLIKDVEFAGDRAIAIGRLDGSILLYDLATESLLRQPLEASGGTVFGVAASADMQRLVSVADDGLIRIWQNDDHGPITELVAEDRSIVDVSVDGSRYLLRGPDGSLEEHSTDGSMRPVGIPTDESGRFYTPKLSYDGRYVTQSGQSAPNVPGPVRVVEVQTGRTVWSDSASWYDMGFVGPGARRLFLLDFDWEEPDGIGVVDLSSGELIARLDESDMTHFGGGVVRLFPTADGAYVDATSTDGSLRRMDANTLEVVFEALPPFTTAGEIGHDRGSDRVYLAGWSGQIGRIDVATGEETWTRSTDSTGIMHATLSPDRTIVAGLHPFTETVALFDAETLRPLGRPIPIRSAGDGLFAFTQDGDLLVNGPYGVSRIELDPDAWQAAACRVAGRNLTTEEWDEYIGDEPYRATCPDQPPASA